MRAWWLIIGMAACGGAKGGENASDSAGAAPAPAPSGPIRADSTGPVPMDISAEIGGRTYPIIASGECGYEPEAAIYDKPAEMWIARAGGGANGPFLNLVVWKLKSGGPEQFNLGVQAGSPDLHEISTVAGGVTKGSGTALVTRSGSGGVITVDGTDATGAAVTVAMTCTRFDPIVEAGGR